MTFLPMTDRRPTVRLIHAHQDTDKVLRVRDILRCLDCTVPPADADAAQGSQHIFLYCRTAEAERAAYVQQELDAVRRAEGKRLYTIDLERDFAFGALGLSKKLIGMLKQNHVFLTCPADGQAIADSITACLTAHGYAVHTLDDAARIGMPFDALLTALAHNGVLMPIITPGYLRSAACYNELCCMRDHRASVLPIVVDCPELAASIQTHLLGQQGVHIHPDEPEPALCRIVHALAAMAEQGRS